MSATHPLPTRRQPVPPHLAAVGLFFALTLEVLYPLWLHPAARLDANLADPALNSYILAWDLQALFHQILDFFQANIFWPHANALAYGEHMLVPSILLLPLAPLAPNAAALHNLSLIQAFFFSALGAYLLALFYFRAPAVATLAGLAYGFAAYRISQSGHLQLVHGEFLPLMVLGFEKILAGGRRGAMALLALAALGQWLTSWYWAVFTFGCLAPYFAARLWAVRRQIRWQGFGRVLAPLVLAALLTLPVAFPYLRLNSTVTLFRPSQAMIGLSAMPGDFLVSPARSLLYGWLHRTDPAGAIRVERALFPGLFVLAGLVAACAIALRRKSGPEDAGASQVGPGSIFPQRLWLCITLALLVCSFGPAWNWRGALGEPHAFALPYEYLRHLLPFSGQMRVPARWILPALLGVALLAADSWRRLLGSQPAAPRRLAATLAAGVLLAECLTTPLGFVSVATTMPPAIAWLNQQPAPAPVLFLPVEYDGVMLDAAWLRQPLANGYNGYFPPLHLTLLRWLDQRFPDPQSLAVLRAMGIRFVLLDPRRARADRAWPPERLRQLLHEKSFFQSTRDFDGQHLFDLGPAQLDPSQFHAALERLRTNTPLPLVRH